jgi:ribonuclease HI
MGALFAVKFSCDLGLLQVILEGDSKQVVQAININGAPRSRFGQVIEDILILLPSYRSWQVKHVKTELNEAAHGLAKIARNARVASIWIMEEIPRCIHDIVVLEQAALIV